MTDFEQVLESIIIQTFNAGMVFQAKEHLTNDDAAREKKEFLNRAKTLVADTVLKAIGEDESFPINTKTVEDVETTIENGKYTGTRNQLRKEIKAKVFEMLGIKEK